MTNYEKMKNMSKNQMADFLRENIMRFMLGQSNIDAGDWLDINDESVKNDNTMWISVENEIPNENVLALNFKTNSREYGNMLIGHVIPSEKSQTGFICVNGDEILHNVTHWQSLPETDNMGKE